MPAGDLPLTLADLAAIEVGNRPGGKPRIVVNSKVARALAEVEITSVLDLLQYYPRRYHDRTRQARMVELRIGESVTVVGEVLSKPFTRRTSRGRTLTDVDIGDDSGRLRLSFFNQKWRERQLSLGLSVAVYGKVEMFRGTSQMTNPVVDLIGDRTGRVVPVYPQSEKSGLYTGDIARLVAEALQRCRLRGFADPLAVEIRERFRFISRARAFELIHRPSTMADCRRARTRLVFDELLRVQLELVRRKRRYELETHGIVHATGGELVQSFYRQLPFELTRSQRQAIAEIEYDLALPHPMHRLLQGDVGSGKTLVAVVALLSAVDNRHQGAFMAPTSVLAEQHHATITEMLGDLNVPDPTRLTSERPLAVGLLTGTMGGAEQRSVLDGLAAGQVDMVIGTHALIQEAVDYHSLSVVIIDEQHRFGVEQRAALRDKASDTAAPDVLVMTATPIPRTAAMTVYGDLDVSVLSELPPGRTPVTTAWARSRAAEATVFESVRSAVLQGRQAYVVCPTIDDSDKLDVRSASETYQRLTQPGGELAGLRVGMLHGRVDRAGRYETMERFRAGSLDVLVATTVVEVGVDVPNATVMVVLDADRFGIAQLHQLRGRVGRGRYRSSCHLVAIGDPELTPDAVTRLEALVDSTDGFELAKIDLEIRGEGTIMGARQRGRNDLKLASLRRDEEWVFEARRVATEIINHDPELAHHGGLVDEIDLLLGSDDAEYLLKS